ncbi:hypothetical protein BDD12DRAFT_337669 [Trichophaea hybrida]|nr:hypothetical protein BDD12DRAFT_337669 [Trichophaea hybrida]
MPALCGMALLFSRSQISSLTHQTLIASPSLSTIISLYGCSFQDAGIFYFTSQTRDDESENAENTLGSFQTRQQTDKANPA